MLFSPRDTTAAALSALRLEIPSDGRVILALPPMADDDTLRRLTDLAGSWGCPVAADNAGQLKSAPDICMTTEGVPVFNAETERLLRGCGIESAVLSPELSGKEIALDYDGEYFEDGFPAKVSLIPHGIQIMVPKKEELPAAQ